MRTARDKPGEVRHVDHEIRIHRISDLPELFEIDRARIRREPRDDEAGPFAAGEAPDRIIVEHLRLFVDAVANGGPKLSGRAYRVPVREMPAHRELHTHDLFPRRNKPEIHGEIRRRTGIRLDVHVPVLRRELKKFQCALFTQHFDLIDELVAAIIPRPRISFRIFIGERGTERMQNF